MPYPKRETPGSVRWQIMDLTRRLASAKRLINRLSGGAAESAARDNKYHRGWYRSVLAARNFLEKEKAFDTNRDIGGTFTVTYGKKKKTFNFDQTDLAETWLLEQQLLAGHDFAAPKRK